MPTSCQYRRRILVAFRSALKTDWREGSGSRVYVFENARGGAVRPRWRSPRAGAEFVASLDRNGARRRPVAGRPRQLARRRRSNPSLHRRRHLLIFPVTLGHYIDALIIFSALLVVI